MARSTVFTSNRSQAVRLPKAMAFPDEVHQVEVIRVGSTRVITLAGRRWDDLFDSGPRAGDDFPARPNQPKAERRGRL